MMRTRKETKRRKARPEATMMNIRLLEMESSSGDDEEREEEEEGMDVWDVVEAVDVLTATDVGVDVNVEDRDEDADVCVAKTWLCDVDLASVVVYVGEEAWACLSRSDFEMYISRVRLFPCTLRTRSAREPVVFQTALMSDKGFIVSTCVDRLERPSELTNPA